MTDADRAELQLLSLANEKGKFGLQLGIMPSKPHQQAFERGIDQHWFNLVDISPIPQATGDTRLMRVFKLTDVGTYRLAVLKGEARQ